MKCTKCDSEMILNGFVASDKDGDLDHEFACECGNVQYLPKMRSLEDEPMVIRKPFKLDWNKVKDFNELIWLLNECDLWVHNPHPKYNELKERFS